MQDLKERAEALLAQFKGQRYAHGTGCLERVGALAREVGGRAALVRPRSRTERGEELAKAVAGSLENAGVEIVSAPIYGARPNAPREDVYRLEGHLLHRAPDLVVVVGGGSGIDAAKAAAVLASFGDTSAEIDDYFGVGKVTDAARSSGKRMTPIVAVQTAAGSAAHLTKYSNVTDVTVGQKKLIVDEEIVPARAVFDYGTTMAMSRDYTYDGAIDGISHMLEVYYGAKGDAFDRIEEIARVGIALIVGNLERALAEPRDAAAREALGLGTDLGGYAIMTGSTNGGHLTSFSLVDVTTHGRACGIMNPYYTVFFAPAIERQLHALGEIFAQAGLGAQDHEALSGRALGETVAAAMVGLAERLGFPTKLSALPDFNEEHIERALKAAKDPQLAMKLAAMPIPLDAGGVDRYMRPILEAASTGRFSAIQSV